MSVVDITKERERVESGSGPLHQPSFLQCNSSVALSNPTYWTNVVLPEIAKFTFVIKGLPDCYFFRLLRTCPNLPFLHTAITSVNQPDFYHFSGMRETRTYNPYIDEMKELPNLSTVSLGFHTAALTESLWSEKYRLQLEEEGEVEKSKQLRVLSVRSIVEFYDLQILFTFEALKTLNLNCIDSEQVGYWSTVKPTEAMHGLKQFFDEGFRARGKTVQVAVNVTRVPWT
jgi:hypothetical protein